MTAGGVGKRPRYRPPPGLSPQRHPAENLLRPDDGGRWRGAAAGEKQISVVLEVWGGGGPMGRESMGPGRLGPLWGRNLWVLGTWVLEFMGLGHLGQLGGGESLGPGPLGPRIYGSQTHGFLWGENLWVLDHWVHFYGAVGCLGPQIYGAGPPGSPNVWVPDVWVPYGGKIYGAPGQLGR